MRQHPVGDHFVVGRERRFGEAEIRVEHAIRIRQHSRLLIIILSPTVHRARPVFDDVLGPFASDLRRGLVGAKALEARLPQNPLVRPFGKPYFGHERWRDPVRAFGFMPSRRIYEGWLRALETDKGAMEGLQHTVGKSGPDLARVTQLSCFVVADQQCAEALSGPCRLRKSTDDELLALLAFDL